MRWIRWGCWKAKSQEISFLTLLIFSPSLFLLLFCFHQDRKSTNIVCSSTAENRHYFIHSLHVMFQPTLVWKKITCENASNMMKRFGSLKFHWRGAKMRVWLPNGKKRTHRCRKTHRIPKHMHFAVDETQEHFATLYDVLRYQLGV